MTASRDASLPALPKRDPRAHKNTFGVVAVIGGCAADHPAAHAPQTRMIGGPALSALASLRTGAGLARLVLPAPILNAALAIAPECTGVALPVDHANQIIGHAAAAALDQLLPSATCIVVGPGLGPSEHAPGVQALVMRAVNQDRVPVVLDADALNALALMPDIHRDIRAPLIITPHVGEFRRLASAFGLPALKDDTSPAALESAARALAGFLGCIVILKSAATVVADAVSTWKHDVPNPALATAGSGDVLAGILAGLIAQHPPRTIPGRPAPGLSLFDLARHAVEIHSAAGAQWAASHHAAGGLLATDLLPLVPELVHARRAKS